MTETGVSQYFISLQFSWSKSMLPNKFFSFLSFEMALTFLET